MINVTFIILAAGKGTRMNSGRPSSIPKVLIHLDGKPMVSYIIKTLKHLNKVTKVEILKNLQSHTYEVEEVGHRVGVKIGKPILVIGYKGKMVKREFGESCDYVWQRQRLGTGHAAKLAIEYIARDVTKSYMKLQEVTMSCKKNATISNQSQPLVTNSNLVFILQGDDSAFYKADTLAKIIQNHLEKQAVLTFITTRLPDVKDLGRVVRNKNNNVIDIVEKENMTPELEKTNEINCGAYLFNLDWGRHAVKKITRHLKGGKEYPLPDIIKIALADTHSRGESPPAGEAGSSHLGSGSAKGYMLHACPVVNRKVLLPGVTCYKNPVIAYEIPSCEWRGINSPDQLRVAENKISRSDIFQNF